MNVVRVLILVHENNGGIIFMKKAKFYTPVITAFDEQGNLDIQGNKNVFDHLIAGGIDGIVVMGSTGEFFAMTDAQKRELIDLVISYVAGRVEVIIGTACMRVDETIELSNYALAKGADAVMVISPYYFTLSEASIFAFFDECAAGINGDMYLYNFPARTGYDLTVKVTLDLLRKHQNIIGYKDTVFEVGHTRKLLNDVQPEFPDFIVLAGFDENLYHVVISGGHGAIGGISNLYPEICAAYTAAVNAGDQAEIFKTQRKIDKLMDIYTIGTPFFPIIKKAMMLRGVEIIDACTAPYLPATEVQIEQIKKLMAEVEAM